MNKVKTHNQVAYNDVFDEEMLNLFNEYTNLNDLFITNEKFYIDIDELIQRCNLSIEYKELPDEKSGELKTEERVIIVNENHSKNRQRFTKAHELAHFLHKHTGTNHRTIDLETYTMKDDYKNEKIANDTAANILMPKIQMEVLYNAFKSINMLEDNSPLNTNQKEMLYNFISEKLNVSKSAASYRLLNLGMI